MRKKKQNILKKKTDKIMESDKNKLIKEISNERKGKIKAYYYKLNQ